MNCREVGEWEQPDKLAMIFVVMCIPAGVNILLTDKQDNEFELALANSRITSLAVTRPRLCPMEADIHEMLRAHSLLAESVWHARANIEPEYS